MFAKVYHTFLREMKKLLRSRGINTGPTNQAVAGQLAALLDRELGLLPELTEAFLSRTTFDQRSEAYKASLIAGRQQPPRLQAMLSTEDATAGHEDLRHSPARQMQSSQQLRLTTSEVRFAKSTRRMHKEQQRASYERSTSAH